MLQYYFFDLQKEALIQKQKWNMVQRLYSSLYYNEVGSLFHILVAYRFLHICPIQYSSIPPSTRVGTSAQWTVSESYMCRVNRDVIKKVLLWSFYFWVTALIVVISLLRNFGCFVFFICNYIVITCFVKY